MFVAAERPTRPLEPEHLGALQESAPPATGPHELFPGEERYLGRSAGRRRRELWARVSARVEPLLETDEHVLYVAPATGRVTLLQYLGMGWMAFRYNQVALVLTDRRLLEVLLDCSARSPEGRVRSHPWRAMDTVRYRFGSLTLKPMRGATARWTLGRRGDRKLIKQLVQKIASRQLARDATAAATLLHCPGCGTPLPPKPARCDACGTLFRSQRLAALLSLAFPGAGLLYAGHPVLATFDFLGEALFFGLIALLLSVTGDPVEAGALLLTGAVFLVATKIESLHVGHILISRGRTEPPARRERWRRLGVPGALMSMAALALALFSVGRFVEVVDRDLEFSGATSSWSSTRNPDEWEVFEDDPDLRSQWFHEEGWTVSVFAYPLAPGQSLQQFREEFLEAIEAEGEVQVEDDDVPGPQRGFRVLQQVVYEDGEHYSFLNYFVFDEEGRDVHQVLSVVPADLSGEGEQRMRQLLAQASWEKVGG